MATCSLSKKDILAILAEEGWRSDRCYEERDYIQCSPRVREQQWDYYYHLDHQSLGNQELSHFIDILTEATELGVDSIFKIREYPFDRLLVFLDTFVLLGNRCPDLL